MPIQDSDLADIFEKVADFLELEGENPFRAAQHDKIEHMMLVTLLNEREYELH